MSTLGAIALWGGRHTPRGWHLADGSRLRRRTDPALYDLLRRSGHHNRWRRWVVHLPDLRHKPLRPHTFTMPATGTPEELVEMVDRVAIIRGSGCGDTTCTEEHP